MKVRYDQRKIEFCFLILRLRIVNEYRGELFVAHFGGHLNGEKAKNFLELLRKKNNFYSRHIALGPRHFGKENRINKNHLNEPENIPCILVACARTVTANQTGRSITFAFTAACSTQAEKKNAR